jgi:hypothetical protein
MEKVATRRRTVRQKMLRVLVLFTVLTGFGVLAAPSPANASEPSYYLYDVNQNVAGPCGASLSIGDYAGYTAFSSPYWYSSGPTSVWWESDDQVWQYEQFSFSSANSWYACHNFKYVFRYYGANKVHRYVTTRYFCLADLLSCTYRSTTYSSYTIGW